MLKRRGEKLIPILIGCLFVLFLSALLYFNPRPLQHSLKYVQNLYYDLLVRFNYKPINDETPIVIIDIDDRSLASVGRWPWNRKKFAELISKLYELGARTVAIDIIFSEKEENIAGRVAEKLKSSAEDLAAVKREFDYDGVLSKSLEMGNSVLGFAFLNEGKPIGDLSYPLFLVKGRELSLVPLMTSYLAPIPEFQRAAKWSGFINASPDFDGVIRYSPMLLRYQNGVYPALSLAAVKLFLNNPEFKLLVGQYGAEEIVEAIQLGNIKIPIDPWGRILIPFRGPPYSIPYISAIDVLSQKVLKQKIENKLVFIGSSATAIGDLVATSIAPVFVGIEVHAQIASGILEGYLPYKPIWEKGLNVALVLILGLVLAVCFPYLGPVFSTLLTALLILGLIFIDRYIWEAHEIALSFVFPLFSIFLLYVLNETCGYLFESRRKKELRAVFGQYVPPECIDTMLKKRGDFGLEGESKELTVLFSDIRQFTSLSEGLSAADLKEFLNRFLTPMTEAIFEKKGTIDKYVGDMVMAFWGAPLSDPEHADHAIECAFEMQKKLDELNQQLNNKIQIGIGINTGTMNVGDMGSKYRRAYTVLGDAVNLASRLESLTKTYRVKIIVGEKTYEMTKGRFSFRLLDRVKVKGKEKSVQIYEPLSGVDQEFLAKHQKGLDAYFQKKWEEAKGIFNALKEKDPLYELYLERIAEYQKNPPPNDWDGSYAFEAK